MAGLPKKYAKMGFKKGWRAYRSTKRKRPKVRTMARRKTKRRRRSSGSAKLNFQVLISAAAYGAVREKLSTAIAPVTGKIPLGNVADEVGMIGVAFLAKKFVKNPMVSKLADAAMIVEGARIGEAIANGTIMGGTVSTQTGF